MEEKPAPVQQETEIDTPIKDLSPEVAAALLRAMGFDNYGDLSPLEALQIVRESSRNLINKKALQKAGEGGRNVTSKKESLQEIKRIMNLSPDDFNKYLDELGDKTSAEIEELIAEVNSLQNKIKIALRAKGHDMLSYFGEDEQKEDDDLTTLSAADRVKVSLVPLRFSKLERAFFEDYDLIGRGEVQVPTGLTDDEGNEITNIVVVEHIAKDGAVKIEGGSFSEYERSVSDAYFSIVQAAEKKHKRPMFTLEDLHAVMPGSSDHPSEAQKEDMKTALSTLQNMDTTIDASKELEKRGYKGSAIIHEKFLSFRRITMKPANGRTTEVYIPLSKPPLLEYAEKSGQIGSVKLKYFKIQEVINGKPNGNAIRMNKPRQAMTAYIIRRIAEMKRSKALSRKILFSTLYKQTGLTEDDPAQKKRHRDFIREMLDYERAVGFISDYQLITKGPFTQRGILIFLNDQKQLETKK